MDLKIIILLIYILILTFLFFKRVQMIFYILIAYQQISAMLSLILIENGEYITEQKILGFDNGSFYWYMFYSFIALIFFYRWCKYIDINIKSERLINTYCFYWLLFFILLLYSIISQQGEYNRFSIYQGGGWFERIIAYGTVIFQAIYVYVMLKEVSWKIRTFYLILNILIIYIKAEEFGGFFIAFYIYYWGYVIQNKTNKKDFASLKNILMLFLIICASTAAVYYKYTQIPDERFYYRIVNQAHTFWGAINSYNDIGAQFSIISFLSNFLDLTYIRSLREDYGLGKLEYDISGQLAVDFHQAGVRFAIGYPSILIYDFGHFLAIFFHIIIIRMYVYILQIQNIIISKYDIILYIIFYKLSEPFIDLFYAGEYANINLRLLILIAFIIIVYNNFNKIKKSLKINYF
jgi:hypothetical protein